jgi:UDP-N-acetyl-D-glucosamine dehydrogenase
MLDRLLERIATRSAEVAVLGLGYVGLPLAIGMCEAGFHVTGIDPNEEKVAAIREGRSYITDVDAAVLGRFVRQGRLEATSDFSRLAAADAISVCVPTPLRKTKDPDISFIIAATREISRHKTRGQLVILESTTYPGTTTELLLPSLSAPDFRVGEDFFLAFSPERVDPGNRRFHIRNTPKVIGGVTEQCSRAAEALYSTFIERIVLVSSPEAAEMVKLLENTFRSVNIGLVNEFALMCDRLGLDVWEIIDAAATKPFGFVPFYPGPGLGGHCIPIDPHYLSWKMRSLNYRARFIELADAVNTSMPHFVVRKLLEGLNEHGRCVKGTRIHILGVSYKRDVADTRESPALDIIAQLRALGGILSYSDPYCPELKEIDPPMRATELDERLLQEVAAVVIVTDHTCIDYGWLVNHSRLIIDTRNATRGLDKGNATIIRI